MRVSQQDMEMLLDVDFCVFLQNAIQAPVRLSLDEKFYVDHYISHGFEEPSRLRRFVERTNIRKFFSPLHYHRDHPISKLLYGSGNLEFIANKKK